MDEAEAYAIQDTLRARLLDGPAPQNAATFAGVDVAYGEDRLAAAVVVLGGDFSVRDTAVVVSKRATAWISTLPARSPCSSPRLSGCRRRPGQRTTPAAPPCDDAETCMLRCCELFDTPAPLVSRQDPQG